MRSYVHLAAVAILVAAGCRRAEPSASAPVTVPILMYHQVGEGETNKWWVPVHDFAVHMQQLEDEGYQTVLPEDLVRHLREGSPLPPRPVIITLDDGGVSAVAAAEPILREHGFQAVVYLPTAYIADELQQRLVFEGTPCLTWPEIRAAIDRGTLKFGAHGHSHQDLRYHPEPAKDIQRCRAIFAEKAGVEPDTFCYPSGRYYAKTIRQVEEAGFTTAVTCNESPLLLKADTNLLELPRVHVIGGLHKSLNDVMQVSGRLQ